MFAAGPRSVAEAIFDAGRKGDGSRLLAGLKDIHREMAGFGQGKGAARILGDANEQKRRIEADRGEAVGGKARRLSVGVKAGDDRHPRSETSQRVA